MSPDRLGPYRIVKKLGRGGMGTVYLGVDDAANHTAAVKLLAAEMAQHADFRDRFKAEIDTLRTLHHPNIVQIFGFGEQENHIFYAMEYVSGSSLEAQLGRGRSFQWREVAQFGIETARALRHAHDRGIIHRDIKPGNLLLTDEGTIKLSDFGIARLFWKPRVTGVGNVIGTAEFMAAEQAEGRAVDQRSDLYSLGAVLYVLLARRPLYNAKSYFEMLEKQRAEKPAPLRTLVADLPAEFDRIIHRLLEKDPDRRFATATVVQRRLEAMLQSLSVPLEQPLAEPDHVRVDPAPVGMSLGAELPPVNPLAVTVEATHLSNPVEDTPAPADEDQSPLATAPPKNPLVAGVDPAVAVAEGPAEQPEEIPPAVASSGRFVAVLPGELDAVPQERTDRPWISPHTWALVGGLVALWLLAWYLLQPPSADALYRRIQQESASDDDDELQRAENDIHELVNRFPGDPRRDELNESLDQVETARLELRLKRQAGGTPLQPPPTPLERYYIDALNASHSDIDQGLAKFQAMVDLFESGEENSAPERHCIQLAKRRIEELGKLSMARHKEQSAAVQKQLARADELAARDPPQAAKIRAAVIRLYADKPWAKDLVQRARKPQKP